MSPVGVARQEIENDRAVTRTGAADIEAIALNFARMKAELVSEVPSDLDNGFAMASFELPAISYVCVANDHGHCFPAAWGCRCACHGEATSRTAVDPLDGAFPV
jgi:hypothetical protein